MITYPTFQKRTRPAQPTSLILTSDSATCWSMGGCTLGFLWPFPRMTFWQFQKEGQTAVALCAPRPGDQVTWERVRHPVLPWDLQWTLLGLQW